MSKHTVIRWTQSENQDFTCDNRGWPKGKRRKWSKATEASVCALHKSLVEDPEEFFYGATALIKVNYNSLSTTTIIPYFPWGELGLF